MNKNTLRPKFPRPALPRPNFPILSLAGILAIVLSIHSPLAEAQRPGGLGGVGNRPGGAAARPATPPNLAAAQQHFGNASVVHRDATQTERQTPSRQALTRPAPSETRPMPARPASAQPADRNPADRNNATLDNLRNADRNAAARRPADRQPVDRQTRPGADRSNADRPSVEQLRQNFGPDNRSQIFGRGDHTTVNRDGPDWKNWENFNSQRLNNTVINKVVIDNRSINIVRNNFNQHNNRNEFFTPAWYNRYPGIWIPGYPTPHVPGAFPYPPPRWWWSHPSWENSWGWFAAGFFAGAVTNAVRTPIPYHYGSNIVYVQDTVYVNNVPYVSSSEYYQQAQNIAQAGAAQPDASQRPATGNTEAGNTATETVPDEWLPMGTFAVVADGNQTESKRIVQIATNKQGQVRGNLINQESGTATELYGSVDSQTQRVAFKAMGNDEVVAECGLWNLTQDSVPILVHLGQTRTESRTLIRLTDQE